jgi:hypothetical protein
MQRGTQKMSVILRCLNDNPSATIFFDCPAGPAFR